MGEGDRGGERRLALLTFGVARTVLQPFEHQMRQHAYHSSIKASALRKVVPVADQARARLGQHSRRGHRVDSGQGVRVHRLLDRAIEHSATPPAAKGGYDLLPVRP
jgi:hypothetical protein